MTAIVNSYGLFKVIVGAGTRLYKKTGSRGEVKKIVDGVVQ